jgi:DNA repair exonuclease SbcCD ATPase subunit
MATKTQWAKAISQITKRQEAIGKERDKLDDLISELETLKSDCSEAYNALQEARDALSRLV